MSKLKQTARHAESTKSSPSFAHRTATVAVAGGLIAGVGSASSAVAAEQTPRQVALTAATTPLELQTVTPAKSLVIKTQTAKKTTPKVSRSSARKALTTADTERTKQLAEARAAKAAQRAEARRAARAAKAQQLAAEQRVSRAKARQALTAQAAPVQAQAQATTYKAKRHVQQAVTTTTSTQASAGRSTSAAVNIAAGLTGIPYVYGGSSLSGIDCSGFVAMVYGKLGIALPHQSEAIKAMTTPTSNPQPGDLVFLPGHVALYAGNGMVYEARHPGTVTGLYPLLDGSTFGRLN